jgi:hypothetical protein
MKSAEHRAEHADRRDRVGYFKQSFFELPLATFAWLVPTRICLTYVTAFANPVCFSFSQGCAHV